MAKFSLYMYILKLCLKKFRGIPIFFKFGRDFNAQILKIVKIKEQTNISIVLQISPDPYLRTCATKRALAPLRLVCVRVCMDLYEHFLGKSVLSYKLKFQIS